MLLHCHVAGHGEVIKMLLHLLGVVGDFVVLILPGVLDTSVEVILERLDVFDDLTYIIFSFFKACGAHRGLLGGGCTAVVQFLLCGATRVWFCRGWGVGEGEGGWGPDVEEENL
jgi:hypothetical protein